MDENFDVPSRLTEGRPAVANLQHYVWACHQLGYRHPDLTAHAVQIGDWYGTEEGMDLEALRKDCLAFEGAHRVCQDALAVQDRQLSLLSAVWQGAGARAAHDFLGRHGEASATAAAAVRTAAAALYELRENLWQAVDAKVAAVIEIEAGPQAQRADWLAAAATVTTGVGDRAAAAELVDQAVKPFVDNSIRFDWLAAMHAAATAVADAYQRATGELTAEPQPDFELAGDLGPTRSGPTVQWEAVVVDRLSSTAPAGPTPPVLTVPSEASAFPAIPSAPPVPTAPTVTDPHAPSPEAPVGQAVPAAPSMTPLGGMGPGTPSFGGGLSGLGQHFADALSGLLGGPASFAPAESGLDAPGFDEELDDEGRDDEEADDEPDDEGPDDDLDDAGPDEEETDAGQPEGDEPADEVVAGQPDEETRDHPVDMAADSAPAPTPAPPPAEPLPPADGPEDQIVAAEQLPCAIAADELPQVGDAPE